MAYRNKTYVCFDADNDMWHYIAMTGWKAKDGSKAFNFHNAHEINNLRSGSNEDTIKKRLRERLLNTKVLVVLIGESTKNLYKYVRWEIEYAINNDIPIIAVNLNGRKSKDNTLCPAILKDKLAIHIPYGRKIINYALNNWPDSHKRHRRSGEDGSYYYGKEIYDELDL